MVIIKHLPAPEGHIRKAAFNCALSDVMYHLGEASPRYPVPAIDYYNSLNPDYFAIGTLMEWTIPLDIQTKFRCID